MNALQAPFQRFAPLEAFESGMTHATAAASGPWTFGAIYGIDRCGPSLKGVKDG